MPEMSDARNGTDYLTAVVHAAQYLSAIHPDANPCVEFGEVVHRFFGADLVAVLRTDKAGNLVLAYSNLPGEPLRARLCTAVREPAAPVLESGFLSTEIIRLPKPYSVVLLPLRRNHRTDTLLVVGDRGRAPLPRHLLDIYLAVAGLMESTLVRLGFEAQLRRLNEELETRVQQRTVALERALHELQEVNYSVSHDLRTPLRAIDGFAKLLLSEHGECLNDEGQRLLRVVRENAQKMGELIDDLSIYAHAGRVTLTPSRVEMTRLVENVWHERQPGPGERRVEFRLQELPSAWGDPALLRQVFEQLLDNALKFTRGADPAIIEVYGRRDPAENIYAVRDNGIGFDMRYAHKLFGVFQRLHPEYPFEGTGIGLAVVKQTVTRHGGRVWAGGSPGAGATFYFSLPARNPEAK